MSSPGYPDKDIDDPFRSDNRRLVGEPKRSGDRRAARAEAKHVGAEEHPLSPPGA